MTPADTMLRALVRASFILELDWRSTEREFVVRRGPWEARVEDAFVFGDVPSDRDDSRWIDLRATAIPGPAQEGPVCLTLTVPAREHPDPLQLANEVNRLCNAPVHYAAETDSFVVRATIVYAGYQQPERELSFCRSEATLNLFMSGFVAARRLVAALG